MFIKSTLTTEDRNILKKEMEERPKLPCGHFVENAIGLGIVDWAPDFVCAACIHEGKSLREAFEVCAMMCEDRSSDETARAIRKLAKEPEEIAIRRSVVQAEQVEQNYGEDAALAFIISDTSSDSIPVNEPDLGQAKEEPEGEAWVHTDEPEDYYEARLAKEVDEELMPSSRPGRSKKDRRRST
ncbi:hypothetical protein LCGC14_0318080 [marine sediment metagenome]|uniref:Uncharacterized protein n=1 Tax=marine sediment metagenome TaxID=412755 RepID=A0A0F9TQC7_9ZZZZ